MRVVPLKAVADMVPGQLLEAVRGRIIKIGNFKSDRNQHGPWSLQTIDVQENGATVRLVLFDRDKLGDNWKGETILVVAGEGKGGKITGLETEDHEYNGTVTRRIKVRSSCSIEIEGGGGGGQQAQEHRQEPRQQAPQQRGDTQYQQANPAPQQRQSAPEPKPKTKAEIRDAAKMDMMEVATLYTMAYDVAVVIAHGVLRRHGHVLPPEAVGALTTTMYIEANKRQVRPPMGNPLKMEAPKFKLCDLYDEEYQKKWKAAAAAAQPPQTENESTDPKYLQQMPDQQF